MLCEIGTQFGFIALWITLTVLGLLSMLILSGLLFWPYYYSVTFDRWIYKTNPSFPSAVLVKKEIIHMCKGLSVATLCPAFTLMMSKWGMSKGYCGLDPHAFQTPLFSSITTMTNTTATLFFNNQSTASSFASIDMIGSTVSSPFVESLLFQSLLIFFFTDFYEYGYHWIGHRYATFWSIHRHHHMFYNPSPFAVIADEYLDQFVRTLPMVILPLMTPINMDLLFAIFATLFYGYGVYLHWGYESTILGAHNPIFNTAYHHYMHHAISAKGRPIYTGFFFKLWDNVFGTLDEGACRCHQCRPKRTLEQWALVEKPDYSVLLSLGWWLSSTSTHAAELNVVGKVKSS